MVSKLLQHRLHLKPEGTTAEVKYRRACLMRRDLLEVLSGFVEEPIGDFSPGLCQTPQETQLFGAVLTKDL